MRATAKRVVGVASRHAIKSAQKIGHKGKRHARLFWHWWLVGVATAALLGAIGSVGWAFHTQVKKPQGPTEEPYWNKHLNLQQPFIGNLPAVIDLAAVEPVWPKTVSNPLSFSMVVNKKYKLDQNFVPPDLIAVNVAKASDDPLRAEAAHALEKMFASASASGIPLIMNSGFRSYASQQALYNQEIASRGLTGADEYSARPGFSEHQSGLAADVAGTTDSTAASRWLAGHAHEYGFIVRYQTGKEAITGYHAEPWHIRYVGTALANKLFVSGQCMEEYFGIPGGGYAN